ncbi:hypothetical protein BYT27DRAFT_7190878 [Phlegmacium glaucopus]|nr:hypothetical protein BYT27DRAFT_7190878 [Phlegmacium glaucopus]
MGGDHKCPVCEATFTRPQHVARHMRSHTGDRPYKCQYCGDQFARSDLLSRHVNKCHANEKPLPSTGVRRKGSASASRATTSKQVCDQCVQANTSCDGCNPCAKCIQRKFRCTFVKFHRQTAPVGPGHNIRLESSSSPPSPDPMAISSRAPIYHHHQSEDDFILGPPPTVVPTMAEALYGATPFTFPPLYPTNDMGGDSPDYVGKYRAHAELFGSARSGMNANTSSAMNSASTGLGPNLYDPRPPSTWLGWAQPDVTDAYHQQQRHVDLTSDPPPSLSPHAASSAMNGNHSYLHSVRYS